MTAIKIWKDTAFYSTVQMIKYLLLSIIFISFASCNSPSSTKVAATPQAVRTAAVRIGSIKDSLQYVGTVHSQNEIKVLARVAGKLAGLPVKEGESAKRGMILARIAAPEMDARVSRLQAEVARVREESSFLCKQSEIDQELLSSNAISKVKADAGQQKCDSSRAALRAVKAGLHELDVMAGNTLERAPFAGTVLQWLAEAGENVMPGRPIMLFGDNLLEIRIQVHEKDIAIGIKKGTQAIVQADSQHPLRANVSFVAPMAVGVGRMMEVRIPLSEKDIARFKHGMSVDIAFIINEKNDAVAVPINAVYETKSKVGVYLVRDNIAHWLSVTPSIREDEWVAVEADIKHDDRVIVGNLEAVKDGMAVYPIYMERNKP